MLASKNNGEKKHRGSKAGEKEHLDEHTMYNESDRCISRKTFKCKLCDKLFSSKQNLRKHIDARHTVCKFACKLCQKVYSRPQGLRSHVRSIHEGVHYKCTYQDCDESFKHKDQLNIHILGHQGKFMYICSICSHGYNHKGNFESHQNSHMEGKAYKCGKCNKWGTNYLQDLKCYLHVCQVESNLKCPESGCGGTFKCQAYLDQHIKNVHHKRIPFICPMCGEKLWHGTSKKNHLKKHQL